MRTARCIAPLAALLLLAAPAVQAQAFRTYLSLGGNDANPCTIQQPCRLLPAALAAVQAGGEVWILDSANYNTGPVDVDKAVTILAVPGALGSVVALGGNALDITTSGTVTLRNLSVTPFPGNATFDGVRKSTAGTLLIQDSNLFGFASGAAVFLDGPVNATIVRSVIRDNQVGVRTGNGNVVGISDTLIAGNSLAGVRLGAATGGSVAVDVTRSLLRGNTYALHTEGGNQNTSFALRVIDSRIECTHSGTLGVNVSISAAEGISARATVSGTAISGCGYGVSIHGPGTVKAFLVRNTITDNTTGVEQGGAAIVESAGNNAIRNNGADVSGSMTGAGSM